MQWRYAYFKQNTWENKGAGERKGGEGWEEGGISWNKSSFQMAFVSRDYMGWNGPSLGDESD